jgi:hypothetical protein
MKMENEFVLLAKEASIAQEDNMLSLHKVIEEFNLEVNGPVPLDKFLTDMKDKGAGAPIAFSVSSSWLLDRKTSKIKDLEISYEIIKDGKVAYTEPKQKFSVPANTKRIRMNTNFISLPVIESGEYFLKATVLDKSKILCEKSTLFNVNLKYTIQEQLVTA